MVFGDLHQFDRAGGASYPTADPGQGYCRRLINGDAPRGAIVMQAVGDIAADAGRATGERSVAMTVQVLDPADEANYAGHGIFSVSNPEDGVAVIQDTEGEFVNGWRMVKALVEVPVGGFDPLMGFVADFATGMLKPKDGTSKVIAMNAAKVNDPGVATIQLVTFHFNGITGFGI